MIRNGLRVAREEAKEARDDGDTDEAIAVLQSAASMVDRSEYLSQVRQSDNLSDADKEVFFLLADIYGMLGNHYRRCGNLDGARAAFARGAEIELNPWYGVDSSYSMMGGLVMDVISGDWKTEDKIRAMNDVVDEIARQTRGSRRLDVWAWADRAQGEVLLGRVDDAYASYDRYRQLASEDEVASSRSVLETLHDMVAEQGEEETAGHLADAIGWLGTTS